MLIKQLVLISEEKLREASTKGFIDTNDKMPDLRISFLVADETEMPEKDDMQKVNVSMDKNGFNINAEGFIDPVDFAKSLRKMADWIEKNKNKYMFLDD